MAFSFCVLGSGSSGNCTVLVLESGGSARYALIDGGLSPRETKRRLAPLHIELDQVDCMMVTHFDRDHFHPGWRKGVIKYDIEVLVHRRHRHRAFSAGLPVRQATVFEDETDLGTGFRVEGVLMAHDALGTVGYVIEHDGVRLGFATDLGRVPDELYERFTALDALAFESNYDRRMQVNSGRPDFLKRRIMGGMGHLSNEQSFDAVQRIAGRSSLLHVALLHLSRECNDPRLVKSLYTERDRALLDRLTITNQLVPTPVLRVDASAPPVFAGQGQFAFA